MACILMAEFVLVVLACEGTLTVDGDRVVLRRLSGQAVCLKMRHSIGAKVSFSASFASTVRFNRACVGLCALCLMERRSCRVDCLQRVVSVSV